MIQQAIFLLLTTLLLSGCGIMHTKDSEPLIESDPSTEVVYANVPMDPQLDSSLLVSQYIRRIFEDSKGYLWFGTNNDGVVRHNPKASDSTGNDTLRYFSVENGFGGYAVRGMAEDKDGNVWFATDRGVTKYDGKKFFNYTTANGLPSNDVWSILVDEKGTIWAGTMLSACRFTGETLPNGEPLFTPFVIPEANEVNSVRDIGTKIIWEMLEDESGKIWFTTYGGGAYVYDGTTLTNISAKEGLTDSFVNSIIQDKSGNIWFATQRKGVFRWNNSEENPIMKNFSAADGLDGLEVWAIMEDNVGNIWSSSWGSIGRYYPANENSKFTNYTLDDGMTNCCVQCIYQDSKGTIWLGSGNGLFRYQGDNPPPGESKFVAVMKNGPWK